MVLREVKPLSKEQWEQVTNQLESGPTEESIKTVEKALRLANRLKEA